MRDFAQTAHLSIKSAQILQDGVSALRKDINLKKELTALKPLLTLCILNTMRTNTLTDNTANHPMAKHGGTGDRDRKGDRLRPPGVGTLPHIAPPQCSSLGRNQLRFTGSKDQISHRLIFFTR